PAGRPGGAAQPASSSRSSTTDRVGRLTGVLLVDGRPRERPAGRAGAGKAEGTSGMSERTYARSLVPGGRRTGEGPAVTAPWRRDSGRPPGPADPHHSATATSHRKREFTTVTALTLSTAAVPGLRADAIVIGVAKGTASGSGTPVVAPGAEAVDHAYDGGLAGVLETLGASGA